MSARAGPSRLAIPTPFEAVVRSQDPHHGTDYDEAIARANLEEIRALRNSRWSTWDHQERLSDRELALQLAAEEAVNLASVQRDRALAVRLSTNFDDDAVLAAMLAEEDLGLLGHQTPGLFARPQVGPRVVNNGPTANVTPAPGSAEGSRVVNNSPLRPAVAPPPLKPAPTVRPTGHNCVICTDPIFGVEVRAPCGDYYDRGCILELFEAATKDESLFPPRCCRQNIPLESVQPHMSAALLDLFNEKSKEFSTLMRVYCANPTCSRFLGEQIDGSFWHWIWPSIKCAAPGCNTSTCTRCKNKFIFGHRCVKDEHEREVLNLGTMEGWARCPGCEQLIELNHGCYHMTCLCKTQFCYLCKARWKTCTCPQWDERRLLAAAEVRADAELGLRAPQPPRPAPAGAHAPVPQRRPVLPWQRQPAPPLRVPVPPAHLATVGVRPATASRPAPAPPRPAPAAQPVRNAIPHAMQPWERLADGRLTADATGDRQHVQERHSPVTYWVNTAAPARATEPTSAPEPTPARAPARPAAEATGWRRLLPSPSPPAVRTTQVLDTRRFAVAATIRRNPATPVSGSVQSNKDKRSPATEVTSWRSSAARTSKVARSSQVVNTSNSGLEAVSRRNSTLVFGTVQPNSTTETRIPATTGASSVVQGVIPASAPILRLPKQHSASVRTSFTPSVASPSTSTSRPLSTAPTSPTPSSSKPAGTSSDPTRRQKLIREWVDRLREDHDCHHEGWKYRHGGGLCENCHHNLPIYLFRCKGCAMLACNRCRKNRL